MLFHSVYISIFYWHILESMENQSENPVIILHGFMLEGAFLGIITFRKTCAAFTSIYFQGTFPCRWLLFWVSSWSSCSPPSLLFSHKLTGSITFCVDSRSHSGSLFQRLHGMVTLSMACLIVLASSSPRDTFLQLLHVGGNLHEESSE